jgi:Protein of unknown function (DUF3309)
MIRTLLLVVIVLLLIGAFPTWPHSANWGYAPSGGLGAVLIVVLVLMLLGVV